MRVVKSPAEIACMREAARIVERVMRDRHRRGRSPACASATPWRDLRRPGRAARPSSAATTVVRADAADRRRHLDAAPDVERRAVRDAARRRSSSSAAAATATTARSPAPCSSASRRPKLTETAEVDRRGPRDGARRGRPGRDCEAVEAAWRGVIAPPRPREGVADRLLGRPRLPARLGRAHDQPAARRHERAAGRRWRST